MPERDEKQREVTDLSSHGATLSNSGQARILVLG